MRLEFKEKALPRCLTTFNQSNQIIGSVQSFIQVWQRFPQSSYNKHMCSAIENILMAYTARVSPKISTLLGLREDRDGDHYYYDVQGDVQARVNLIAFNLYRPLANASRIYDALSLRLKNLDTGSAKGLSHRQVYEMWRGIINDHVKDILINVMHINQIVPDISESNKFISFIGDILFNYLKNDRNFFSLSGIDVLSIYVDATETSDTPQEEIQDKTESDHRLREVEQELDRLSSEMDTLKFKLAALDQRYSTTVSEYGKSRTRVPDKINLSYKASKGDLESQIKTLTARQQELYERIG